MNKWTGEKIRRLRDLYGETQAVFCQRVGVGPKILSFWEGGKCQPGGPASIVLSRLEEDLANGKIRELQTA